METLRLKPRQPAEDEVENWDDDDFLVDTDDLTFRTSTTTTNAQSSRRDSHSSHFSIRSELESLQGEEERQVHLPGDDEKSTLDAIAAAANAGVPIPRNVPPSALLGGTIKRLGGRKIKKIIQEDWEHDLELPEPGQALRIKPQDGSQFPDAIRQVSSTHSSPSKPAKPSLAAAQQEPGSSSTTTLATPPINLDRFRDADDDDDFFGDGAATIKVSKTRQPSKPISLITPPTPQKKDGGEDDFESDLVLPSDGKLKLSSRRDIPRTPTSNTLDDLDWAEGSLGTRFGGTRRDGRSNRSSSVSALSPSISSSITAESEDETFDGLVLPDGPLDLGRRLQKRRQSRSPQRLLAARPQPLRPQTAPAEDAEKDDFFSGLNIGDGAVFESKRLTLHRNVVLKDTRPASPARPKTAVSLTFTNKPVAPASRLPRPMGAHHERTHTQSSLEPVSESGGPIPPRGTRRSLSRMGHSSQSSITSLATPATPSSATSMIPSTPRRREVVGQKTSNVALRNEPTTTNAQLLRLKRSLPALRGPQSPAKPMASRASYERPPSRTDLSGRPPSSTVRPKTPVDRTRPAVESAAAQARRNPVPFLPAGASIGQSHNVNAKNARMFRRHDSENAIDFRPMSRAMSRSTMRSPSPTRRHREKAGSDGSWHTFSKPRRSRHFGDGHELDGFDDLPTSAQAESKYMRPPVTTGPKVQLRNRVYQNVLPDRTNTPSPLSPHSPARHDYLPRFARDTAASRIARETSLAQRAPGSGPLAPLTTQRIAQLSTRPNYNPQLPHSSIRSKKARKPPQKPSLISNLSQGKGAKTVNGMFYNPESMRWEGNENALNVFDVPASSPSTASIPAPFSIRDKENATPKPALITNINSTKTVQVVGGMVFDPQNMCWLKRPKSAGKSEVDDDPMDGFNAIDSDEDDVFKDIPDLDDNADTTANGPGRVSDIKDDWLVGEEFDVGPEFVRRQREEEVRWRKKCEKWLDHGDRNQYAWRMTIRDLVTNLRAL